MERSPEIEAVVRRFWKAFIDQDRQALANMTTDNPDLRWIFTGDDEWIKGTDRYSDVLVERAKLVGLVGVEFDRLEAFEHGDAGWSAAVVVATRDTGEVLSIRNTATFIIEAGVWRLTQNHTSRGVPTAETFGYEISGGLASLVGSLDEQAAESVVSVSVNGTVTLMFTDIEDSTQMSERLGDAVWSDLIGDHFASLNDAIRSFGGRVIKTLGDGVMIAFPAAREALGAAIDMQRASTESKLRIRIGIHTGDAVHTAGDYVGIAVNKAARITSAADGGEILASSVTAELAGNRDFLFGPERTAELKGLSGTHRLYPVDWHSAPPG